MADNVTIDPGAGGATVAADDVGGVHYQRVKLDAGGDGVSTPVVSGAGLPVVVENEATVALGATDNAVLDDIAAQVTEIAGAVNTAQMDVDIKATDLDLMLGTDFSAVFGTSGQTYDYDSGAGTDTVVAVGLVAPASGGAVVIPGDATAGLKVNLGADNDVTVTGTVDLGATDNAVLDNIDADLTTVIGHLDGVEGLLGTIDTDTSGIITAVQLIDNIIDTHDEATPVTALAMVGGVAQTMDDSAPPNRVSAESDAVRLAADLDGGIFAHPHGPQIWKYHLNTSTAQTDTTVHASAGAGLSLYITDVVFASGAATAINMFLEESTTTVLGPWYLEAVAGRGVSAHFTTPVKMTAATALTITTSASVAHSVEITGYVAPA